MSTALAESLLGLYVTLATGNGHPTGLQSGAASHEAPLRYCRVSANLANRCRVTPRAVRAHHDLAGAFS